MAGRLASELVLASKGEGNTFKKKEDTLVTRAGAPWAPGSDQKVFSAPSSRSMPDIGLK
jgi:hypothetical protein